MAMDDRVSIANTDLVLNGGGLRQRLFFKVYAMGLYLPKKIAGEIRLLLRGGDGHGD